VADVYKARIDSLWPEVRDALRDVRDQVGAVRRAPSPDGILRVTISNPDGMAAALDAVKALATPVVSLTGIGQNDIEVTAEGADTWCNCRPRKGGHRRPHPQKPEIIRNRGQAGAVIFIQRRAMTASDQCRASVRPRPKRLIAPRRN
jgi:preprotein translocase subunit SecD